MINSSETLNLSFIIPAYNCEKYLEECIISILNQKMTFYEIIVVNDGSTDNTLSIAKSYERKYPHIVKVLNKKNGGAASARNFGMKSSLGRFITFVDSDDLILDTFFQKSFLIAQKENVDIFINDMSLLLNGKIRRNELLASDKKIDQNILEYVSNLAKFPGSSCSKFFKRSFLASEKIIFTEGIVNEDVEFMLTCFRKCTSIYHCSISWYVYRQNVLNSVTNTVTPKNCSDMFIIINKQLQSINKNESKFVKKILGYEYSTLLYYFYRLKGDDKKRLKKYFYKYRFLLNYSMKGKIIWLFYILFGLSITSNIVYHIYMIKRIKESNNVLF